MLCRAGIQVAGAGRLRRSARPLEDERIVALLGEVRRAIGLARRVQIAATDRLTSPAVVGVLVPVLILPLSLLSTLTPEQIRFVLLHELAHIRRGDYLANLFQLFAEALLFFNPALWWLSRQLRIEREACCDALAVSLSGAPAEYARTLVRVAESALSPAPAGALAFGDNHASSTLAERVQRMLVPGYRPRLRLTWRAILAAFLTGGGLLYLSALGTRVTLAAILPPEQRIDRIEKKMAELGQKPLAPGSPVQISGRIRTADGTPVPKRINLMVVSTRGNASSAWPSSVKDGAFTTQATSGTIFIGAEVTNFAPAVIGPFDGFATNRFENLELVLERGFDVPVLAVDADSGRPLPNAAGATMVWMNNMGCFQPHYWQSAPDGSLALTHCADVPMDLTVNVPGYEILQKRFDHVRANEPLRMSLRRGEILAGMVLDKTTGQPVPGAEFHLLFQSGGGDNGNYQWNDALRLLGRSDVGGAFSLNQLRRAFHYYLGASAPGHESVILERKISAGESNLLVRLGPEMVVRGRVLGGVDGLPKASQGGHELNVTTTEKYENNSYGGLERVPLVIMNGVATFQFTNRVAGPVILRTGFAAGDFKEERTITASVDDWVVDLANPPTAVAKAVVKAPPTREVIFRFEHPTNAPPRGTVTVSIPDNLETVHLTAHDVELEITNDEVRADIPIGGLTSVTPKHLPGYWFNRGGVNGGLFFIAVTNGIGPLVIKIPLLPAGAIYARARNADGTPAGSVLFGLDELKRAPARDILSPLDSDTDGFSGDAPRQWISGPLPLGGTYQIHAWRGNAFCVSKPIGLTEANPDEEVTLQFKPGKTFSGIVLGVEGQPLRDAEVKVVFEMQDHSFGLKSAFTDERGRFQLENLTPELGGYSVEVEAPGVQDEQVKLDLGSQPQTIRLKRGRTLAGRVVEAGTGNPVPAVQVSAADAEHYKVPMQKTQTDAAGRFEFNSLGDGNYTFYVAAGEFQPSKKYHADGSTNIVLTVKFQGGSSRKPNSPPASVAPPQINIKAKFIEGPKAGFAVVAGLLTNNAGQGMGIWNDAQLKSTVRELEQKPGYDVLTAPEATTLSGHPTQMQAEDVQTIVVVSNTETNGGATQAQVNSSSNSRVSNTETKGSATPDQSLPIGPVLDLVATMQPDGITIDLDATAKRTDFLGYFDSTNAITVSSGNAIYGTGTNSITFSSPGIPIISNGTNPATVRFVTPRFDFRQDRGHVKLLDGQTLVLGVEFDSSSKAPDGILRHRAMECLALVTPTLVNPDGTRVHSDEKTSAK